MLAAGVLFGLADYLKIQDLIKEDSFKVITNFEKIYDNELEQRRSDYSMTLETLLKNNEIIEAFAQNDRDALKNLTLDFYNTRLKPIYNIDQFQFHTPPAMSFLRVHTPDKYGDDLSSFRKTVVNANLQESAVTGIEVGRAGPGFRIVYPITHNEKHVGTVEIGSSLEVLLLNARNTTDTEYAIAIYNDVFTKAKRFASEEKNDLIKGDLDFYAFSSPSIKAIINDLNINDSMELISVENRALIKGVFNIKDYSEDVVGKVFIFKDATNLINKERAMLIRIFALVAIWVFIVTVVLYLMIVKMIIAPIDKAVKITNELAKGNLAVDIVHSRKDEVGQLLNSIKNMANNMNDSITMVNKVIADVNNSVNEISLAIETQASISSEQSASLSEITSTMEELSSSSSQITEHSHSVVEISSNSLNNTKDGNRAIGKVNTNMNEINRDNEGNLKEILELGKKSKDITKVMELINSIADQTKLIAFNAALEASSAGESGKRFNIVAMEIRRLADNVMESTNEIENKISEIQEAVNRLVITSEKGTKAISEGIKTTSQAEDLLREIVLGVESTTNAAKEISLSTQQQRTAIGQVVIALREIEEGARQTSISISQIHKICMNLAALSSNLHKMSGKFKVKAAQTQSPQTKELQEHPSDNNYIDLIG
ncbi:methyl-accepting chemotaxis sensory transducer [Candidatus Magnetoovum chiemensis]|nr:methyl-accepting chemotaxis sensory transducer [Candidatus Magnetoovum chiemensis]